MTGRKYRWDKGLRVRVLGLLVFLLSLLIALGATLSVNFRRVEDVKHQAEQTRQNVLLMEEATGSFAEMTSALRGYLLTGKDTFLQPYHSQKARMEYILEELRSSAKDGPQRARVFQVGELVHGWQAQVAEPEINAKRSNQPNAGDLISNGSGMNYIDEVRKAADAYIQSESDRLNGELASATTAADSLQRLTWTGIGLAAMLVMGGFVIFARSLTASTGALSAAAAAIAAGGRGVVVNAPLDGELQEVAEAFSAMSMTLAAQEEELQAQQEELIAQNEELMAQQEELQTRTDLLERQDRQVSKLNRIGEALIGTIEIEPLSHLILDEYLELYGGSAGALLVCDPHSEKLIVQAERWLSPDLKGARLRASGPLARCVDRGEVVMTRYPETTTRIHTWHSDVPVMQEIYIPLVHANRVTAVAVVASTEAMEPSEEAAALWSAVARQAAVALSAALNHLEVKRGLLALQEQAAQVEELNAQLEEERDRASAQLDIYLSIVSTMRAGAWLTDTGGNLLVVNQTFRDFFGDVPEGADLETVLAGLSDQVAQGEPFIGNIRTLVRSRDGSGEGTIHLSSGYVLQWSSAPVGNGKDLLGRLFTFQDVTELTKLDSLKSEFVSTVSHELRTPLTSIMGYLSLVMNEAVGKLEPQQKEFLQVVRRNTDRLANLINDILDIQRIESGRIPLQLKPVQMADVVRQVAETFRVAAEQKGLKFEIQTDADLPLISADPDRLTQIASNLVSNAVKYTKEGSVKVSVTTGPSSVQLTVADSGVGIAPAEQKRIFERFFRGENKYAREAGGTGLGLAIVKMMVEEHGGQIRVESEPGKGSKFIVSIPLVLDAAG